MPLSHPIETEYPALRTGFAQIGDDTTYYFAVYSRKDYDEMKEVSSNPGRTLTGWYPEYNGPGRRFSDECSTRVFKHKVLVTQRCGLDI